MSGKLSGGGMFNVLDYAIIGAFLVFIGVGFFTGVTKVLAAIIAIYFGALLSAALYQPVAREVTRYVASMGLQTAELLFFLLLFLLFSSIFTVIVANWLGGVRFPRRIAILDNLGGAALGVIVSGLAVTLAALALAITLQAVSHASAAGVSGPLVGALSSQIGASSLVPVFLDFIPFFSRILSPWFPGGLPPILRAVR